MLLLLFACAEPAETLVCPPGSSVQTEADDDRRTTECVDAAGRRDGPRVRTIAGERVWRQSWRQGQLDGEMIVYQGERPALVTRWASGRLDGAGEGLYPDGSRMWSGQWKDGRPDGPWAFHAPKTEAPTWTLTLAAGEPLASADQPRVTVEAAPLSGDVAQLGAWRVARFPASFPDWAALGDRIVPPEGPAEVALRVTGPDTAAPIGWRPAAGGPWRWSVGFASLGLSVPVE